MGITHEDHDLSNIPTGDRRSSPTQSSLPLRRLTERMFLAVLVSPSYPIAVTSGMRFGYGDDLIGLLLYSVVPLTLGPTILSLSLSPSRWGCAAGLFAGLAMILPLLVPEGGQIAAPLGAITIVVLSGYVRHRRGYLGLLAAIVVGVTVTTVYFHLFDGPRLTTSWLPLVLGWSSPFAFVWSSVVFFPELFRRRVGWVGVLIWAALQATIFGVGSLVKLLFAA